MRLGNRNFSLSTNALNFGNVLVNGNVTQAVTLKNSGQSDVQIAQIAVTGGEFSASGMAAPVTISRASPWRYRRRLPPKQREQRRGNYGHEQCDESNRDRGVERRRSRSELHHVSFAVEFEF